MDANKNDEIGTFASESSEKPEEDDASKMVESEKTSLVAKVAPKTEDKPQASHKATGLTSISQQYTEQPTAEQPSGAIYDTAQYHAPVDSHPAKKKKSKALMWIVWILVLLLVGVAAGAGYYFLTTQR